MNEQNKVNDGGNGGTLAISRNELSSGIDNLNLLDEKDRAKAETFLKTYISSGKTSIKTIAEGLAIIARAQDLNLPFSSCTEHIHVINGKTGLDVHLIKALLSKAGVVWECTKDYTPQYQYTDGNNVYNETQLPSYCVKRRTTEEAAKATNDEFIGVYPVKWYMDLGNNIYNEFQINNNCIIALNKIQALKLKQEGKFPIIRIPAQPVDYVTEYKFTRYRMINGKERITTAVSHFSFTEAQAADLFTKDTYKKYPRILIGHRAFTLGARDIASDAIMGCYETSELKIMNGMDINAHDIMDASFTEVTDSE